MQKIPIIMIKTDMKELYVSKYMLRRTRGGQFVLDLIKYMGNLHSLRRLDTENAYFAIADVNYKSENEEVTCKLGKKFEKYEQKATITVTLNDKDRKKFVPYRIRIFCNSVALKENSNDENFLNFMPRNEIWITYRNESEKKVFKFEINPPVPNLDKVLYELDPYYSSIKNVYWLDQYTYYKENQVYKFTVEWAEEMLQKLQDMPDDDMPIYPSHKGIWTYEKIEEKKNRNLPAEIYLERCNGNPNKKFWQTYLRNFKELDVIFNEDFKEGKVLE